nr:MAG TPA: hypothetical protein [Caudoviricetes sp.]
MDFVSSETKALLHHNRYSRSHDLRFSVLLQ